MCGHFRVFGRLTDVDYRARARFATASSDLLTDANAYEECVKVRIEKNESALRKFCENVSLFVKYDRKKELSVLLQNFISLTGIRDVTTLRQDFTSSLSDLGFIPRGMKADDPVLNTNSTNENLVKGVILGGFWPRVGRVSLPKSAIKFDRIQAGAIQRENTAKEFKIYDLKEGSRVFLHPASILFEANAWKSSFLTYFQKQMTSKMFLRDATEVRCDLKRAR